MIVWEASLGIYCAWEGFRTPRDVEVASAPAVEPTMAAV